MLTEAVLERRLLAVEDAIAEIRRQLPKAPAPSWLGQVIGSLQDEPAFDEVLDLGRAYRDADRPPEDDRP